MRRIKWFCIALLICAFSLVFVNVSAFTDIEDSLYKDEIETLSGLGLIEGTDMSTFSPDEGINRAEIAAIIAKIMGCEGEASVEEPTEGEPIEDAAPAKTYGKSRFSDVPAGHWAEAYIAYLTEHNILHGYEDGSFGAEDGITLEQMLRIIVRITGYEPMLSFKSLETICYEEDMLKGFKETGGNLNRGQAAKLIYNSLFVKILKTSAVKGDNITFDYGKTLLEERLELRQVTGVVNANDVTRLVQAGGIADDMIEIDRTAYTITDTSISEMLGYYVTAYVDTSDNRNPIKYIVKNPEKYEEEIIPSESLENVTVDGDKVTISYYTDGKGRTKTFTAQANILYNGVAAAELDEGILNIHMGEVRIIEADAHPDTVMFWGYQNYVAGHVNHEKGIITDKFTDAVIDLDDSDKKIRVKKYGLAFDISRIEEGNILSVYESMAGYTYVEVSDDTLEGTLNEVGTENVMINGRIYPLAKGLDLSGYVTYTGVFYFDFTGKLAAIDRTYDTSLQYGYLIKIGGSMKGLARQLTFKILKTDGTITTYENDKNIKVNNIEILDNDTVDLSLFRNTDGSAKSQLIKYMLTSGGKMAQLYTPGPIDGAPVPYMDTILRRYRQSSTGFFRSNRIHYYISPSTVLFKIPEKYSDKDDDYTVIKYTTLAELGSYTTQAYDASDVGVAKALTLMQAPSVSAYTKTFVVNKVNKSLDPKEEGVIRNTIHGIYLGKAVHYIVTDEAATDLRNGDLLQVGLDKDNHASIIKKIANIEALPNLVSTDDMHASNATGIIEKYGDGILKIKYADGTSIIAKVSKTSFLYVYDTKLKTFYNKDVSLLEKGKKVFVKVIYGNASEIIMID